MCTKFTASQNKIADLFQVERKKFFTSITGREYKVGKKPPKSEKVKTSTAKEDKPTEKQPSQPPATSEVDPDMSPLEDVDPPKKKFKFKIRQ